MARLTFRQGIVRHQEDGFGNQQFLDITGGYVSLIVSPDPTIITFAHGTANYLFTESVSVPNAWGTFSPGVERWLYWDLNLVTGVRAFGYTVYEPVEQSTAPNAPAIGQMWFNTTTNKWTEWNGSRWVEVVRVFACRLDIGLVPRSMSINAPNFKGTQVGLTSTVRAGALIFDVSGAPVRKSQNQFFTTEDVFLTGVPTGASLRVNNILIPGQAQAPIAAYTVVEYYEFNRVVPASPYTQGIKVYGMVEEDADTNEIINFVTEGIIFNEDWDWVNNGAEVNDPVYISATGQIQLNQAIPDQLPVGVVIDRQKILFSPRLFPQVSVVGGGGGASTFTDLTDTPSTYTGAGSRFLKVNAGATGLEFVTDPGYLTGVDWGDIGGTLSSQSDLQTALNGKANTSHTHVKADITDFTHTHLINDVTGLQSALDSKLPLAGGIMDAGANITFQGAGEILGLPSTPSEGTAAASKAYVDALVAGRIWKEPILDPNIVGIDVNDPPGFPVTLHESFIVGPSPTGAWSGLTPGTVVSWSGAVWLDILGRPIQIGDRFGISLEPLTYPSSNLTAPDVAMLITILDNTPGSVAWTNYTPTQDDTVFVNNELSQHFGHIYTFIGNYGFGTYGTEYKWVETGAPVEIVAGNFLSFAGNTLNVTEYFNRIFDADENTVISVDLNPGSNTNRIKMQLGLNPVDYQAPASGYVLEFTSSAVDGFYIETPSGAPGSDVGGISLALITGTGDGGGDGGEIVIISGEGGSDGYGGNIIIEAGQGHGSGNAGGDIEIVTRNSDGTSNVGAITIGTGNGTYDVSSGGDIDISAGNGDDGGDIFLDAGFGGGALGYGGDVSLTAGNGVARGGNIDLQPGSQTTGSPPADHGSVNIRRAGVGIPSELRFYDGTGVDYVGFKAFADITTAEDSGNGNSTIWTLPDGDGGAGQVLSTDGAGTLQWATTSGLPASTLECSVLVADAVGGWTEKSVPELCRPYDVAAQIFGQAPDGGIIFKFKTPQKFKLLDYGHQMDAESLPTVASKTFDVTLNGVSIGSMTFDDTYGPTFDLGGPAGGTLHDVLVGDVLRIISPSGDNSGLEDIALTLRGIIEPAAPCGDLSVTFTQALYSGIDSLAGIDMSAVTITVAGSATSFEWAVIAVSGDSGSTWYSLDNEAGHLYVNPSVRFGGLGGVVVDSESKYYEIGDFSTNIAEPSNAGLRYRIRLTAFGPAGIASDVADFQFTGA